MPSPILALTREQIDVLLRLSLPLARIDRRPFLELVAQWLQEQATIDDGTVHRVAVECQKTFWTPPGVEVYGR